MVARMVAGRKEMATQRRAQVASVTGSGQMSENGRYNLFVGALLLAFVVLFAIWLGTLGGTQPGEFSQSIATVFGALVIHSSQYQNRL